ALGVTDGERRLPVGEVIGTGIMRRRSSVARRQILEELDSRSGGGSERGDVQPRTEHIVQPFLLRAVVLAAAHDTKTERITIAGETPIGVRYHDRRVIDAEKEPARRTVPAPIALVRRKPEDLEEVAVRVPEVERADPRSVHVPVREPLGRRRRML